MLVQVHALYPNGHGDDGHVEEDENEGWRCVDTKKSQQVFSLEDLPTDFIKNNNLTASDSANSYLSISSATMIKDNDQRQEMMVKALFEQVNARISDSAGSTKNRIKIGSDAAVTVSRTSSEGRRRLLSSGNPTGTHSVLVVRVSDGNRDAPTKPGPELSNDIFSDTNNLVCESFDLSFLPLHMILTASCCHF